MSRISTQLSTLSKTSTQISTLSGISIQMSTLSTISTHTSKKQNIEYLHRYLNCPEYLHIHLQNTEYLHRYVHCPEYLHIYLCAGCGPHHHGLVQHPHDPVGGDGQVQGWQQGLVISNLTSPAGCPATLRGTAADTRWCGGTRRGSRCVYCDV